MLALISFSSQSYYVLLTGNADDWT